MPAWLTSLVLAILFMASMASSQMVSNATYECHDTLTGYECWDGSTIIECHRTPYGMECTKF